MVSPLAPSPFTNRLSFRISNGKQSVPIQKGQTIRVQAVDGGDYHLTNVADYGEGAVKRVMALTEGHGSKDLVLLLGDDTRVVLTDFFARKSARIKLPVPDGPDAIIESTQPIAATGEVLHAYGDPQALGALTDSFASQYEALSPGHFSPALHGGTDFALLTGISPQVLALGAVLPLGLVAAAASGRNKGGSAASTDNGTDTPDNGVVAIAITDVTGDNVISQSELDSGITVSGTSTGIANGGTVLVDWGSVTKTATVRNGVWSVKFASTEIAPTKDPQTIRVVHDTVVEHVDVSFDWFGRPAITIDPISQDDNLAAVERDAGLTITGAVENIADGTEISLSVGGRTFTTLAVDGRWSVTVGKSELPRDSGDVTVQAGDTVAYRSITVESVPNSGLDDIPAVTLDAVSGDNNLSVAEQSHDLEVGGAVTNIADGQPVTVTWGTATLHTTVINGRWSVTIPSSQFPMFTERLTVTVTDGEANNRMDFREIAVEYPTLHLPETSTLTLGGLLLKQEATGQYTTRAVAAAGDFNGDGLADMAIGAPGDADHVGKAYIVFGHTGTDPVELSAIAAGHGGFAISGDSAGDHAGFSVAYAGDLNGDGYADVIIASQNHAYVAFGGDTLFSATLTALAGGQTGFAIDGATFDTANGTVAAYAGDVSGDGLADLVFGVKAAATGADQTIAYVVFGTTDGAFHHNEFSLFGTINNDTLAGNGTTPVVVAGAGDDTITMHSGSMIAYAGAGNDIIIVDPEFMSGVLSTGLPGPIGRIDGGSGIDTLRVDGADLAFDLTFSGTPGLANTGAGGPNGGSRLSSIERIDLTGTGDNTLTLSVSDILDMTSSNVFNDGSGWTGLGAVVQKHQLVIDGNAGDDVKLDSATGWTENGTITVGAATYAIYDNAAARIELYIASAVTGPLLT